MSLYKTYALQLDAAYKAARDEHAKLYSAVIEAENARNRLKAYAPALHDYEYERKMARANFAVEAAQEAFSSRAPEIWKSFRETRNGIRAELEAASHAANMVNPDAIDPNGLELLKSGVMSLDDMESFVSRYDGNPTMLRLIGKYAQENASQIKQDNPAAAARLNRLAHDVAQGKSEALRRFDDLVKVADHCGASEDRAARMNPSVTVAMSKHWEDMTAPMLED